MKIYFIALIALVSLSSATACGNSTKNRAKEQAQTAENTPAGKTSTQTKNGTETESNTQPKNTGRPAIKQYTFRIVETFPHDRGSYTQGLFWHDGYLYEGTGQTGESRLMKTDLTTGKAAEQVKLPAGYFGEGIAWLDGKIYQLTWTQGRALVWDGKTLERIRDFTYRGEGWGLTTDGTKLYMSDGTDKIYVRDPETFLADRTITVTIGRNRQLNINELEWVEGEIWANIYKYGENRVVRIDPKTGYITGIINFDGIQAPEDVEQGHTDVFNGIAYDPATGRIYVTGKYWNKLYRVEVVEI